MKVLAFMTNTEQTACTRFRLLQYRPHLEAAGITLDARPLLDEKLEKALYRTGGHLGPKAFGITKALAKRTMDTLNGFNADAIFILREASLVGPPVIEWVLSKAGRRPVIFDLDDPIWKSYSSPTYGPLAMLFKMPKKADTIFRLATHITAGNEYVANYARKLNPNVSVIPTVVDTDRFTPRELDTPPAAGSTSTSNANNKSNTKSTNNANKNDVPVVGWIGSHSTAPYLRRILPALQAAAWKTPFKLHIIGSRTPLTLPGSKQLPGTEVIRKPWTLESEIPSFQELDIGLYPIIRDKWSVGKSAFKAVQYGAVGIPTIASPVGAAEKVVRHGETGLLANSTEEWIDAVTTLVKDKELRTKMGKAAREHIVENYSLAKWAPRMVEIIRSVKKH